MDVLIPVARLGHVPSAILNRVTILSAFALLILILTIDRNWLGSKMRFGM